MTVLPTANSCSIVAADMKESTIQNDASKIEGTLDDKTTNSEFADSEKDVAGNQQDTLGTEENDETTEEKSSNIEETVSEDNSNSNIEKEDTKVEVSDVKDQTTSKVKAANVISNETFTLGTDKTDIYAYSTATYAVISLAGSFTLDESQISNGDVVKIADVSVVPDVSGLEAEVKQSTTTTIKNASGEALGVLSMSGNELVLTINSTYELTEGKESFSFTNSTALRLFATTSMLQANQKVVETLNIGDGSTSVTFHEQNTYDILSLPANYTTLVLSSGKTGYTGNASFDIAYNEEGLKELQNSNGATANVSNLKKGDYQFASRVSSNVIPTGGDVILSTFVASETNNKLQTTSSNGKAAGASVSQELTVNLPLQTLEAGLSLEQIKLQVVNGADATYVSKQADGTYLCVQNVSESSLKISDAKLRDTTNSPLTGQDPNGVATVAYYNKALDNRTTYAFSHVKFNYVDPAIVNTVKSELLDSESGKVISSFEKDSDPQEVISEGQSTVKVHYVDEDGNLLDSVLTSIDWPTSNESQGGKQYTAESKAFGGYELNTNATSIPGVTLNGKDKIATDKKVTVDYPEARQVTNVYFVYKKSTQVANIHYIDDTTGTTLKSDKATGDSGSSINYTTEDKIKEYEAQGYELVSNSFKDGSEVFDLDSSVDQEYE
ncbi:MucBP domain-containing protein, partial [Lactococcus petauri]|uniref:mucin-binding protein n=1 Tax=Lactococcus petauri TaxID=1940789 RepID=UPI0038555FF8